MTNRWARRNREITDLIRLLLRQTFLLERKYDKKTGRFQYTKEYRSCSLHLEFIRRYFAVADIEVLENSHMGMIYIQEKIWWVKSFPRLATLYLLILKLDL